MFNYTRNMQLALSDKLRRAGLGAGAVGAVVVGVGFLISALWIWLAHHLHWGPLGASLAIGATFVAVGLIALAGARRERHPMPTTDDLKSEVAQNLTLLADQAVDRATGVADAAINRASEAASQLVERTGQKVHSVADTLAYKADLLAERAESRVVGSARRSGEAIMDRLGIAPQTLRKAQDGLSRGGKSNAATLAPLLGAFAVGMTLASRFQDWRHRDEVDDWHDADDDWPDYR
ncbi:phage holin family protein [Paracoccus sp. SMMA_5_TC]|uniref:phage holin family protein n=2 Tax=unclassified Paracoccus (in: a-proteobacteria) TaxID=2688777 RepID=UPI0012B3533C|nr:phage holin family protein [Paracoccus sp. SMMA_5_TC]UXU80146.1 phage holin family protein [Paracoccus sp. SMMA_5_TC]